MKPILPACAAAVGVLLQAGCNATPQALGITGPGGAPVARPRPTSDDAALPSPGGIAPEANTNYAPSFVPAYGSDGRYYGNQ